MHRTPPPKSNINAGVSSCQVCENPDDNCMVQCDDCNLWFHYVCVGVTSEIENSTVQWSCTKCIQRKIQSSSRVASKAASKATSKVSKASSRRRMIQLELDNIEEARKLELQRAREEAKAKAEVDKVYLAKKLQLQQEQAQVSSEVDSESVSSTAKQSRTKEWVCTTSNNPAQELPEVDTAAGRTGQPISTAEIQQSATEAVYSTLLGNTSAPIRQNFDHVPTRPQTPFPRHDHHSYAGEQRENATTGRQYCQSFAGERYNDAATAPGSRAARTSGEQRQYFANAQHIHAANAQGINVDRPIGPQRQYFANVQQNHAANAQGINIDPQIGLQRNNAAPFAQHSVVGDRYQQRNSTGSHLIPEHQNDDVPVFHAEPYLTRNQIAARHSSSKDLRPFSGKPEEWPLFISTFELSTKTCGFSPEENLVRLQKCLHGKALDAVSSRLLLPSAVPQVIETLRQLFGRPEIIINILLQKLKNEPMPRMDRLESIVSYSLAVDNLCATMEASGLQNHLCNPILLQDLVEKLPATLKLNWALYQQTQLLIQPDTTINLSSFSRWFSEVAKAASSVTIPVDIRQKDKAFIHAHSDAQDSTEVNSTAKGKCYACAGIHRLSECSNFKALKLNAKWNVVKEKKLCRQCLMRHNGSKCKSSRLCGKDNCTFKHHPLLHKDIIATPTAPPAKATARAPDQTNCNTHQQTKQSVLYRVVPVMLHSRNKSIATFAFLDEGSSLTLLEEEIATELGLPGEVESLCLRWTSDTVRVERESRRVSLHISGQGEPTRYKLNNVRTVNKLSLPVQSVSVEKLGEKFPHLRDLPLPQYTDARPRILIGIDNGKLGLPLEIKEGSWSDPTATRTRLGWSVHGCINLIASQSDLSTVVHHHLHACDCQADGNLHKLVQDYFTLDSSGVRSPIAIESDDDIRARNIMENTTHRDGDRFQTGLLWKYETIDLPDSLPMAKKRLSCLERKMSLDDSLANNLRDQMKEYVAKGYARRMSQQEVDAPHPRKWYLPLFVVTNPNKPTKKRIVWDAAAKVDGISLNSVLLKGPDQLASLLGVLFGFREHRVAVCGDIREMFHQVRVRPEDQHSQRFLWRDTPQSEPAVYVMQVMTFGASCSPSSAQFVKNKNALEYADRYPRAAMAITKRHYVDDLLDSLNTEEEAINLAKEVRLIHSKAGFEIRNWMSNSPAVLAALGEPTNRIQKNLLMSDDNGAEKVLGMWWCTSSDKFAFRVNFTKVDAEMLNGRRRATKREILRTLMSIFDPLGFLASFMVYVKILLQQIWRSKTDWDEQLTDECEENWRVWANMLPQVETVRIPRCYSQIETNIRQSTQLHVFVDASENAFAAVAYLRIEGGGIIDCSFVAAKTKVAPLQPMTIPRLELQGALLGARLAKTICDTHSLTVDKCIFWTDSRAVLSWLASDQRRYRQFVAFRIVEILEITEVHDWRWVPTKMNVADEATKWQKTPDLSENSRWFNGPEFLIYNEDNWPKIPSNSTNDTEEELRANFHHHALEPPCTANPEYFSTWQRLLNAQARLQRCPGILLAKFRRFDIQHGPFESIEFDRAEKQLYRRAQFECFSDEILTLQMSPPSNVIAKSSPIFTYSAYMSSDGLLRVRGRIDETEVVDDSVKRPIILPRDHRITRLVVAFYHTKFHHENFETTINELRQQFAIPRLRQVLKTVRSKCQKCKNDRSKPQPPEMGALPAARLAAFTAPFTFVGVDFFGPMTVVIGRRSEKRWGVIFTCLTIRAIHLEIAHSLSTDSCIMCVRNFMARRGIPKEIYCDNGTNLHGADNELKKAFSEISMDEVQSKFYTVETRWRFNPPASPHMGGSWERLVGSVKKVLRHILPDRHPTDELLRTLLMEAEDIVNSRPLTFVSVEIDAKTALTPNHFLKGSSNGRKPLGEFSDRDLILRKNWRKSQHLANQFWKRWVAEYLPTLTRRTKWFAPVKPIEVGDIVIVVDDTLPRNCWPLGRIVEVKPGKDGAVRRVTVRTQNGLYERPAVKIAVLDVKEGCKSTDSVDIQGGRMLVIPTPDRSCIKK